MPDAHGRAGGLRGLRQPAASPRRAAAPSSCPSAARRDSWPRCSRPRSSTSPWGSPRCPVDVLRAPGALLLPGPPPLRGARPLRHRAAGGRDALAFAPRLSRVYLSSLSPSARAAGVLSVSSEANDAQGVRERYLRTHLKRSVLAAVACCVPILAAYTHFSWRLSQTQERVKRFEETVQRMRDQGQEVSGTVVQEQVLAAGQSMDVLYQAMSLLAAAALQLPGRARRPAPAVGARHPGGPPAPRPGALPQAAQPLPPRTGGLSCWPRSTLRGTRRWASSSSPACAAAPRWTSSSKDGAAPPAAVAALERSAPGSPPSTCSSPWWRLRPHQRRALAGALHRQRRRLGPAGPSASRSRSRAQLEPWLVPPQAAAGAAARSVPGALRAGAAGRGAGVAAGGAAPAPGPAGRQRTAHATLPRVLGSARAPPRPAWT